MFKAQCPSCGAELVFQNASSVFAVCSYCRSTIVRHDLNVEDLGKMAQLNDEWSPMQLSTRGVFNGEVFVLVGRVVLSWERGKWNEWFLSYDAGRNFGWLSEAQGHYCLTFPVTGTKIPERGELVPGAQIELNGTLFQVNDCKEAGVAYSEGELPFRATAGTKTSSIDLSAKDGGFATIDFTGGECHLFVGSFCTFDELKFDNVRQIPGW